MTQPLSQGGMGSYATAFLCPQHPHGFFLARVTASLTRLWHTLISCLKIFPNSSNSVVEYSLVIIVFRLPDSKKKNLQGRQTHKRWLVSVWEERNSGYVRDGASRTYWCLLVDMKENMAVQVMSPYYYKVSMNWNKQAQIGINWLTLLLSH